MQEKESNARGGRREGARRPKGRKDVSTITLRIPEDVAKILESKKNRSRFIIDAIRAFDKEERKRTIIGLEISYTKEEE